ncbi:tRNA-specific adenosine deaminase [Buchnera aphidicola (Eriosoma grossulariae)]|uniref:tRNA adenosine(34) deaminase TadA n=1 Tax=Buchnera aphidicola TaxID=9 RepID=UPI003464E79F
MTSNNSDEYWMKQALRLAKLSELIGEIPIGAVLILDNKIIGNGWNSSISKCDPTAHAEIIALREGGLFLNNYRLLNTTLYVTLEPCLMCLNAIFYSRISNLVYGAKNNRYCFFKKKLIDNNLFAKKITIHGGVLELTCSLLLKNFFKNKRKNKKNNLL